MKIHSPIIILACPQLSVNVGMVARAMLNFGVTQLRLINPRNPNIINEEAFAASAGADEILQNAKIFPNILEAVKDLTVVYATTARKRYLNKPVISLNNLFASPVYDLNINPQQQNKPYYKFNPWESNGILFGAEKSGLSNNDLKYANVIINIPTNLHFSSLNLAQAVMVVCYQWFTSNTLSNQVGADKEQISHTAEKNKNARLNLSTLEELNHFFNYLESELASRNYFSDSARKNRMIINLRNIFLRNNLITKELHTLYRVIKVLASKES